MLLVVFLQSHDEELLQEAASGTDMDGRKAVMNGEKSFFSSLACDEAMVFTVALFVCLVRHTPVCHKYSFSEPSKAEKVALQAAGVELLTIPLVDVFAASEQGKD